MEHTPAQVEDLSDFVSAVHLYPTVNAVVEYNLSQLQDLNRPIALYIQATMLVKHHQKMLEG